MADKWRNTVYGPFPSRFQVASLSELCVPYQGIQTGPFGSQLHKKDYVSTGTPIATVEHLGENRIIHDNLPLVSDHDKDRLSKYILQKGDVLFSRVGSVDRRGLVRKTEEGWLFSGRCLRIRPNAKRIDPIYLSYFFGLPAFKEYIRAIAVGATMPSLNTQLLGSVPIAYPSISEQRAVGHVLGTLDERIELNRLMNETLEDIARALFNSWFVDFDPVRAKMEGRWHPGESLPGLPAQLYDKFPDHLVESELGPIPEGWNIVTVGEAVSVKGGTTPKTKEPAYWNGNHYFATPKDLSLLQDPFLHSTARRLTDAGVARIGSGILPSGSLLLSSRAPIGYLAITQVPVSINQGIIGMVCHGTVGVHYALHWTRANLNLIEANASGTTFSEISKSAFRGLPLLLPPPAVHAAYELAAAPLHARVALNGQETKALAQQRDLLLPRLLTGDSLSVHSGGITSS